MPISRTWIVKEETRNDENEDAEDVDKLLSEDESNADAEHSLVSIRPSSLRCVPFS